MALSCGGLEQRAPRPCPGAVPGRLRSKAPGTKPHGPGDLDLSARSKACSPRARSAGYRPETQEVKDAQTASIPDPHVPGDPARRVTPGASQRFVAATEQLDDGAPVVSVMGRWTWLRRRRSPRTLLLGVAEERSGEAIVDLTECSFFDSAGLRGLARDERAPRAREPGRWPWCSAQPTVLKVFQITGFDERFEIYPSLGVAADPGGSGNGHV